MRLSAGELIEARELVYGILAEIGVAHCAYDIEPRDSQWRIDVECKAHGRWEACRFEVGRKVLGSARLDPETRAGLIEAWGERLSRYRHHHG